MKINYELQKSTLFLEYTRNRGELFYIKKSED